VILDLFQRMSDLSASQVEALRRGTNDRLKP
jgi:hypothetical protein